jgi:hypothetical protein
MSVLPLAHRTTLHTHTNSRSNYTCVHFGVHVCTQQTWRQRRVNCTLTRSSDLFLSQFLRKRNLISCSLLKIFKLPLYFQGFYKMSVRCFIFPCKALCRHERVFYFNPCFFRQTVSREGNEASEFSLKIYIFTGFKVLTEVRMKVFLRPCGPKSGENVPQTHAVFVLKAEGRDTPKRCRPYVCPKRR